MKVRDYIEFDISDEYKKSVSLIEEADKIFDAMHGSMAGMTGWLSLPNDTSELLNSVSRLATEINNCYDALVVIGIGGSYLGAKALNEVCYTARGVQLFFAGWNLELEYHTRLIEDLNQYNPAICVVSKSGTTMETTVAFDFLKEYLQIRYPRDTWKERIYVVTDLNSGQLREEAKRNGYKSLEFPANIGGRYSVFSAAGLLPLAAAGVDVKELLRGAQDCYLDMITMDRNINPVYQYTLLRDVLFNNGKMIETYSFNHTKAEHIGEWIKQLFAESQGKNGKGIFPTTILYSRDLHSIEQYMQDGPKIVFETMINTVEEFSKEYNAEKNAVYKKYSNMISDTMYKVRREGNMPISRIRLKINDEKAWGYLLYFFELSCAIGGFLLNVNPFDQPGVEVYKKKIKERSKG